MSDDNLNIDDFIITDEVVEDDFDTNEVESKDVTVTDTVTVNSNTVNSTDSSFNKITEDNTVHSNELYTDTVTPFAKKHEDFETQADELAEHLALVLDDIPSLGYFKILTRHIKFSELTEALSIVNSIERRDGIRTTKAKLFMVILKNRGQTTKFKKRTYE